MRLKRLIIHGFKSFKDRTIVHFDQGITGIVGPNGCGKSNIVDALFWVMGEQSAKHLRGSAMSDVIFAGSDKYSPASWAEVSLVLGNEGGKHIHIGNKLLNPSEIQLTRKLYRNGDTEYRINGTPCRLKDIQEVFMDTGAGAKSYSIIAQGEINRLVQAKPEERRVMIEEVAGITKFKLRKKESLKKIEQTVANLNRLQDLGQEVDKQLKLLEKQAEKAERARVLKEKIERNELIVASHKEYEFLKEVKEGRRSLEELGQNVELWQTEKQKGELSLEEERLRRDELTEQLESVQGDYNELSKKLAASEERLTFLKKNRDAKEQLSKERQVEIKELQLEIENRKEKQLQLRDERTRLEDVASRDHDTSDLEEQVSNLKDQVELLKDEFQSISGEIASLSKQKTQLDQEIFKNSSKLDEYATGLRDVSKEIDMLEEQYSGVSTKMAQERDDAKAAELSFVEVQQKEEEMKNSLVVLKQTVSEAQKRADLLAREEITLTSKLESLIEINEAMEGVKAGTTQFLQTHPESGMKLLGSSLECHDDYVKAVYALLDDVLNALYSSTDSYAEFENYAKQEASLSADILMVDNESSFKSPETVERLKLKNLGEVISLVDIVTIKESSSKLRSMLEGLYIVSQMTLESVESLPSSMKFKAIVSLDGKMILRNLGGAKILSYRSSETGGVIERNNKISELKVQLEKIKVDHHQAESMYSESKETLESRLLEVDEFNEKLIQLKSNFHAKKSSLEAKLQSFESGSARLMILKNRKIELSELRLTNIEKEEELNKSLSELSSTFEEKNQIWEELKIRLEESELSYIEKKEELQEKNHEARTVNDKLKMTLSQEEDVSVQIEKQIAKLGHLEEMILRFDEEIASAIVEIDELKMANTETAGLLEEKEETRNLFRDQLADLLSGMQERENEVRKLAGKISQAEKDMVAKHHKLSQVVVDEESLARDIFERYQIDLRRVLAVHLAFDEDDFKALTDLSAMYFVESEEGVREIASKPFDFVRRYGQDLSECGQKLKNYKMEIQKLGEINWQAIEDYDRQKKRHDFLKKQESELKESLLNLENAIKQVDEKSKERFAVAFDEVNMRFEKVFPIIFGGGNAQLKMTGSLDSDDSGVDIVAQPPGKKMQNINLMSGGEKAMTAVSLIFSIYLVKPSPFCLLDEVDAPLDDANVGRFVELLREMSSDSQFILITHNKKTMELNDTLYGVTMQEPGISKAVSIQLHG